MVLHTTNRNSSSETREIFLITHPDHPVISQVADYIYEPITISEITGNISPTSEFADETVISELDTKTTTLETSLGFATPTSRDSDSPIVRSWITENLPRDLMSIKELVLPEEIVNPLEY